MLGTTLHYFIDEETNHGDGKGCDFAAAADFSTECNQRQFLGDVKDAKKD